MPRAFLLGGCRRADRLDRDDRGRNFKDGNLKVKRVQGQKPKPEERGNTDLEELDSGMDWTYAEEQDFMGKVFISVFGEKGDREGFEESGKG
ncbi:hypothetical protein F2Q68_00030835 [Brassica cretica]|uniref:Uncharacterized protein n=1 Tax=Brassica cretica TaxID=69181 RepID=A0A8S9G9B8_BRACR|nr:hypothetical protein F2Q68_00030835 [Brassica cretica]